MTDEKPEPDGCVVSTVPLAAILREFVDDWRKKRPPTKGQYSSEERGAPDVEPLSPYTSLAFDTGIPEAAIRRVRNPKRHPVTELHVADSLVAAIGNPGMFHDGTLMIMPNPKATVERQSECCGGSESSSLTGGISSSSI